MQPPAARGRGATRIVGPGERVEHLKEENEGRDEHALGEAFAAQLHHQRVRTRPPACARATSHVSASGVIDDIGVGKEQKVRLGGCARRARRPGAAPIACRSTRPATPAPTRTVRRSAAPSAAAASRAICAVASRLWSSTRITWSPPGYSCRSSEAMVSADAFGLVARRNNGGDGGPRPSQPSSGTSSSRCAARQNPPRAARDRARSPAPLTL